MTVSVPPVPELSLSLAGLREGGAQRVPDDDMLNHWAAFAALTLEAPMACLSLLGDDGATVRAFHGWDAQPHTLSAPPLMPPELEPSGFCVVPDARVHPTLCTHAWVTGEPHVVFMVALVLLSAGGEPVGTLHVMDTQPRQLSDHQARALSSLAQLAEAYWGLRASARQAALVHQALEQSHGWLLESVSHDPLTQVANRRALMSFLEKTLALARRERQPMSVLLLDVKGFKDINATHGDAHGDQVLAEVAGRLSACARGSELVGRMAGDEFMAVLYPCGPDQAALAAERFAGAVESAPLPFAAGGALSVAMAVGICAVDASERTTPDELYRRAAQALDSAKEAQVQVS